MDAGAACAEVPIGAGVPVDAGEAVPDACVVAQEGIAGDAGDAEGAKGSAAWFHVKHVVAGDWEAEGEDAEVARVKEPIEARILGTAEPWCAASRANEAARRAAIRSWDRC